MKISTVHFLCIYNGHMMVFCICFPELQILRLFVCNLN